VRTTLDDAETWFFDGLSYEAELVVGLVKGVVEPEVQDVVVAGHTLVKDTRAISGTSARAVVRFPSVVAWQVVDESYTTKLEEEEWDTTGFISVLAKSPYLDYVHACHGWFRDVVGPAKHYRLWTEDMVIDVVGLEPPSVEMKAAANPVRREG
jgi:hypothetical protein